MGLPCKHILASRKHHEMYLFCPRTVSNRWTRTFNCISAPQLHNQGQGTLNVTVQPANPTRIPTVNEKFKKAQHVTNQLASVLAHNVGAVEFEAKMKDIQLLLKLWKTNKQYSILEMDNYSDSIEDNSVYIDNSDSTIQDNSVINNSSTIQDNSVINNSQ